MRNICDGILRNGDAELVLGLGLVLRLAAIWHLLFRITILQNARRRFSAFYACPLRSGLGLTICN